MRWASTEAGAGPTTGVLYGAVELKANLGLMETHPENGKAMGNSGHALTDPNPVVALSDGTKSQGSGKVVVIVQERRGTCCDMVMAYEVVGPLWPMSS